MKKILIAASLLFLAKLNYAQDLVKKIPANAFTVATIKGDNVFKLMFVKDFNDSFLGKKLLMETSKSLDKNFTSIEDFGIDLEKNMYYFNQLSDSITYHCFLIPLQDANKFERLINDSDKKIKNEGTVRTMVFSDSTSIVKWNNNTLYFVTGSVKSSFFADSLKSAKYGIKDVRFQNNYEEAVATDSVTTDSVITTTEPMVEAVDISTIQPIESPKIKKSQDQQSSTKSAEKRKKAKKGPVKQSAKRKNAGRKKAKPVQTIAPDLTAMDDAVTDTVYGAENADKRYADYQKEKAEQDVKMKRLAFIWLSEQADKMFNSTYASIETNKSYTASLDNKAIAELWISNLQDVYSSVAPDLGTYGKAGLLNGYGSLSAKLFMDNKQFRISTGMELAKEQADSYKKIMDRKLNKKFLKYVNSEKAIGFIGYSIDTKAYLDEFPKLMKQTYGAFLGERVADEIELGSDLFSLLLDEEAVSKVIKGDGLFVINGLNTKDVTYTSYEYDDDYKQKEVTKTKQELLPDFLFMFSSDDNRLMNKLIKYGIKHNYVSTDQNIYKLEKKSPVDIYFMIKDGIVFFGNSLTEMREISQNQYNSKISKLHKDLLSKNNFSFLFNAKNLVGKVPDSEIGGEETARKFNNTLKKMGNVYMKSNPIKGRFASAEISAEIPNGHENALKYLFSLIENAAK